MTSGMMAISVSAWVGLSVALGIGFASATQPRVDTLRIPRNAKLAESWQATTATGITVKLAAVSDSLFGPPERYWAPDGNLVEAKEPSQIRGMLNKTIPSVRKLFLEIEGGISSSGSRNDRLWRVDGHSSAADSQIVYAFIPGISADRSDTKMANGWPGVGIDGPPASWLAQNANTPIYIVSNLMKASDVVLGISDGPFAKIDSFPNVLGRGHFLGKTIGTRVWGTLRVVNSPWDDPDVTHYQERPAFVELNFEPKSTPATSQIAVTAYDAKDKEIATSYGNRMSVMVTQMPNVKRWEVKSRPFQFVVFKNVHFEPI
jgi:hypothetical protein